MPIVKKGIAKALNYGTGVTATIKKCVADVSVPECEPDYDNAQRQESFGKGARLGALRTSDGRVTTQTVRWRSSDARF